MRKNNVQVHRAEVDLQLNGEDDADGYGEGSLKAYSFPDPQSLALKYGLMNDSGGGERAAEKRDKQVGEEPVDPEQQRAKEQALQMQSLVRKLDEKNRKIESLCVLLEAVEPMPGMDPDRIRRALEADTKDDGSAAEVDFRDSKIVALAKKSHRLQMLLNKERANGGSGAGSGSQGGLKLPALRPNSANSNAEQIAQANAALTKELRDVNRAADELKKKNSALVEENKNLSRALSKEIGEGGGVTVEQAVSGGWKGRAQQIVMLKAKIRKLEASLEGGNGNGGGPQSQQGDVDSKAQDELAGMSNERRQAVEALTEERVRLLEANQHLEKKNAAHKARIQTLENEAKRMKENMQVVLDKSSSDDQLLEALRAELQRLKKTQQAALSAAQQAAAAQTTTTATMQGGRLSTTTAPAARYGTGAGSSSDAAAAEELLARQSAEISRLQRLCKNQAEQIDSQDAALRALKKEKEARREY
eukprot:gene24693-33164_t